MHETKSPHVNHIHQYKSHNTIDLDLQSLYSISIRKYYNDRVCSKLFSQSSKLTLKWERALILIQPRVKIPRRRVHSMIEEGAPSGGECEPSVRERAATSPHIHTSVQTSK
jgi:hypothetical protein